MRCWAQSSDCPGYPRYPNITVRDNDSLCMIMSDGYGWRIPLKSLETGWRIPREMWVRSREKGGPFLSPPYPVYLKEVGPRTIDNDNGDGDGDSNDCFMILNEESISFVWNHHYSMVMICGEKS